MTPDLQREFQSLSARAMQQLRDVAVSGSYRNLFSIWVMPSFKPAYRCTLQVPLPFAKGKQPFASLGIWRSDLDLAKFITPVERLRHPQNLGPTMEGDMLWLTDAEVKDFERRIRGIAVPLYLGPATVAGCDGTRFEFRCDEVLYGVSLHWWEDLPIEWRPFTKVVRQIVAELENRRKENVQPDGAATPVPPGGCGLHAS
jgi:hypothetical protein